MNAGSQPRRFGLEVRFDAEPIEGHLYDQDEDGRLERPFSGWLGLMAAIQAASCVEPTPGSRSEADDVGD